jgi:hypothetical protein
VLIYMQIDGKARKSISNAIGQIACGCQSASGALRVI